jgi:hypothetical protein
MERDFSMFCTHKMLDDMSTSVLGSLAIAEPFFAASASCYRTWVVDTTIFAGVQRELGHIIRLNILVSILFAVKVGTRIGARLGAIRVDFQVCQQRGKVFIASG